MAVIFELVVNCGTDERAVESAADVVARWGNRIVLRGIPLPIGSPYITRLPAYIEFSVVARGLGFGMPGPKPEFEPRSLKSSEITAVGHALYDLLRDLSDYQAAVVGWNPESAVDLEDLEQDWLNGGSLDHRGLVLANDLCQRWHLGPEWVAFSENHRWLPYSGDRNLW